MFEVLGEAAVPVEPCQRALDHPAAPQHFEGFGMIGSLDDFNGPLAEAAQRVPELVSGISAIGEEMAQPWLPTAGPGNGFSAIAAFRIRVAPPPRGNGNGGNNALTINTDHSVGAGQFCSDQLPVLISKISLIAGNFWLRLVRSGLRRAPSSFRQNLDFAFGRAAGVVSVKFCKLAVMVVVTPLGNAPAGN